MTNQNFKDFEISPHAIPNNEFKGFFQDYLILDSLLRTYNPKTFFEIGTNFGSGTNIICNAIHTALVYSLDLPFGKGDKPLYAAGFDNTGTNCNKPFTQLRGDSMTFDYSLYPCEGYFVDAGHFYDNVLHETKEILKQKPKIVIYHDADIPEVLQGIKDGIKESYESYELFRVIDTRIAYLAKKT